MTRVDHFRNGHTVAMLVDSLAECLGSLSAEPGDELRRGRVVLARAELLAGLPDVATALWTITSEGCSQLRSEMLGAAGQDGGRKA